MTNCCECGNPCRDNIDKDMNAQYCGNCSRWPSDKGIAEGLLHTLKTVSEQGDGGTELTQAIAELTQYIEAKDS